MMEGMAMAMGMAASIEEEVAITGRLELGSSMEIGMLDEQQEGQEQELLLQEQSPFGRIYRQPRRQLTSRAPRRSMPTFVAANNDEEQQQLSRCSYRSADEEACTAICSSRDSMEFQVFRSPTNSTNAASEDGDSTLSFSCWTPGQLVWAKFCKFPWWPAQVIDERCVTARAHREPKNGKNDVLVRFFGIYNFAWVDPTLSLSNFDMNFKEKSQVLRKSFQKGLKEALEYRDSRRLPLNWTLSPQLSTTPHAPHTHANGVKDSPEDTGSEAHHDESERTVSVRRRKPKVLYEEEERLHKKPRRTNVRRKRIMRELGLAAPYGSPFTFNSSIGSNL